MNEHLPMGRPDVVAFFLPWCGDGSSVERGRFAFLLLREPAAAGVF
jgi:hypothetical protein